MESVDKLREVAAKTERANGRCGDLYRGDLERIADEIEREHGRLTHEAVCKAHADGEKSGLNQARSASEDYRRGCRYTLEKMADTHIALPVDEDGTPIRLGDVVYEPSFAPKGGTVVGMKLYEGWDHWLINCGAWVDPRNCSHEKPDSWEQIIEDATALGAQMGRRTVQVDDFVARCKALAGEE